MSFPLNTLCIRICGAAVFLFATIAWLYGGAQIGFFKTYYSIPLIDPITEIEYQENVPAFLPGIETLFFGFVAFASLIVLASVLDNRASRA